MTTPRHFASFTEARKQFRSVLDAAHAGLVTTVDRDKERFVVVAADHLRDELARLRPSHAVVAAEGGGWSVMLPGLPVHGDGGTFDEAIADTVLALREYAEDWNARLHTAPNHRVHRSVVELVELSTDDQLRQWLLGHANGAEHGSHRLVSA